MPEIFPNTLGGGFEIWASILLLQHLITKQAIVCLVCIRECQQEHTMHNDSPITFLT